MATPRPEQELNGEHGERDSLIRRSWHAMTEVFSPFSSAALASLPKVQRPQRYTRADAIPDTNEDDDGQQPAVRDYHAITSVPPLVRVPKKVATPIRVEGKVWFANERSAGVSSTACSYVLTRTSAWISWLNLAVLLGALSLALFNASKDDLSRSFAYTYALISIGTLVRLLHPFYCQG
jgi:hypothetical protein